MKKENIVAFIKTFSMIERKILVLFLYEKLTFNEISEILKLNLTEITSYYYNSIAKIKSYLNNNEETQ